MSANGWSEGAWGDTGWGGLANATIAATGFSSTATLGDESASGSAPVDVSSLLATTALGTAQSFQAANVTAPSFYNQVHLGSVTVSIPVDVSITGVEGTTESLTGWGEDVWSAGVWGGGVFADVGQTILVSLNQLTGSVGTTTVVGSSVVSVTGVEGTTLLESVLVGAGAIVTEDGMTGSVGLGDEAVVGTCNLTLTGVSGTAEVGQESIETDTGAPVTSVPQLTSGLGTAVSIVSFIAKPSGFSITSGLGQETVRTSVIVSVTTVSATATAGRVIVWGKIIPGPGTTWANTVPSPGTTWTEIAA
jgi:hypothetical protein